VGCEVSCLVTGAGGFIGTALCLELRQRGVAVREIHRGGRNGVDFEQDNLPVRLLEGVDTVVHCAGIAHQAAAAETYQQVNYLAVLELARRCEKAGVSRFIFLSSVKAQGDSSAYGQSKRQAETALAQTFGGSSMSVVSLRPSLVYGRGAKGNLASLIAAVRVGLPRPPAVGGRSMVARQDLCELIANLLQSSPSGYSQFTVTDGESYDLRRLHDAIRDALGRVPARSWLPLPVWRAGCLLLDLRRSSRAVQSSYDKLFGSELYSSAALLQAVDWRPNLKIEDVMPEMVAGALS
jgi:UDP-glucose 4-epimerase